MKKSLPVWMLMVAQKQLIQLALILPLLMVNHSHAARMGGVQNPQKWIIAATQIRLWTPFFIYFIKFVKQGISLYIYKSLCSYN